MTSDISLDQLDLLKGDERIIREAQRRFKILEEYESETRKLAIEDIKFVHGDSDNHYQWPQDIRSRLKKKPTLTVNKTRQHCLQIINEAKQNKTEMRVRPTGGGATFKAAQIYEGILRYIQYISKAQAVFGHAFSYQVNSGVGYWRIVTDYANDSTFDQDIFIRRIKNPNSVYLDNDFQRPDGLDRKFGFVFDDMSDEDFKESYGEYYQEVRRSAILNDSANSWNKKNTVRVCEYYRVVPTYDRLFRISNETTGKVTNVKESDLPDELIKVIKDDPNIESRRIEGTKVEWFLIAGDKIIDRRDGKHGTKIWPGKYIPIVSCVGEELEIEEKLHRAGHARYLKDPQRMYNYSTSAAVEGVALQNKVPWLAPKEAVEDSMQFWRNANTENYSIMTFKHIDKQGRPIPAPIRTDPPQMAPAYIKMMENASQELMMASGQYQATMGQNGNEISGKAINERQRQGENSTYHFIENQAISIAATAEICMDLIPKVMDVSRIVKIITGGLNNKEETSIRIDPDATEAVSDPRTDREKQEIKAIFNPQIGQYAVEADIGPAFATQRQEAFNAIAQILQHNQGLTSVIGDLLFKNADFPGADEIAERLSNMVPPQAKGEDGDPQIQSLNAHIQQMNAAMGKLMEELAAERMKLKAKDQQKDIDVYKAITDRMEVLFKTMVNPKDIAQMMHDLMVQEHASTLQQVTAASQPELSQESNVQNNQNAGPVSAQTQES